MGRAFGMDSSRLVGGLPAITKGFIDRLFLPGMAYKYRDNSILWDKLLKVKQPELSQPWISQAGITGSCMEGQALISFGNQLYNSVVYLR